MISLDWSGGRLFLSLKAIQAGQDLAIVLCGGDAPHIGAVAVAEPRPSLQDASRISATASVMSLLGHKEDLLARKIALELASRCNKVVSVSCGIHLETITQDELALVEHAVADLLEQLIKRL